jgi:hypothetical protein
MSYAQHVRQMQAAPKNTRSDRSAMGQMIGSVLGDGLADSADRCATAVDVDGRR